MKTCLWMLFAFWMNGLAVANPAVVWLWQETELSTGLPQLAETLQGQGFDVHLKSCGELGALKGLKGSTPDVLILPYGNHYPVALAAALVDYSKRGGALLVTGGDRSFEVPVYPAAAGTSALVSNPLDAGYEVAKLTPATVWRQAVAGPEDRVRTQVDGDTVRIELDLAAYAYAATDLPPLTVADAVIELQVRGDLGVQRLSLDFQERDGMRWKHILPVTSEWTTHRVHLAQFLSYNNKARKTTGRKWLAANRAAHFMVGMTRAMGAKGTHAFEIRNVRFLRAAVEGAQVRGAPRFVDEELSVVRWFGKEEVEATPEPLTPRINGGSTALQAGGRILRLQSGPYQGARWAIFDLSHSETGKAATAATVAEAVGKLATSVWQQPPQPRFRVEGDRVVLDVTLPLMNPAPTAATVKVDFRMGTKKVGSYEFNLPPHQRVPVELSLARGLDVPQLDREALELCVDTRSNIGVVFGPDKFRLDARKQLREICNFMIKISQADGRLHGYSFIDNRGIRVLLGGYEIFGDRRYLDAAMRWGMTMLAEQREDGGYRMGYGITSKGEECYVADGGEIVVGILRLATYADPALRERFLSSADRYMHYREEFRVPEGGIGVGWCLHDYGQRPVTPLQEPTRIFAPEVNTYTIGCSLAGAYGHAALRGQKELYSAAEIDADWLMPRVKRLNGAFVESFVFAHAFANTPERCDSYAAYLQTAFINPMLEEKGAWWGYSKGRHALNLFGLVYCANRIDARPELKVEIYRALCAMFSPDVPDSIPNTITERSLGQPEWLYINFGSLGLADFISPLVTMEKWR